MSFFHWTGCPPEVRLEVEQLISDFIEHIPNLTGIYLHGSLALGCFNPAHSDLDLLVVTQKRMPPAAVPPILHCLLEISRKPIPVEISFLNEENLVPWKHPALYDLHYSEHWRDETERQLEDGSWRQKFTTVKRDGDLAAHITITQKCGICLWGKTIPTVFPSVPQADFADSLLSDVEWAGETMVKYPVYTVLNLCRVYAFLRDGLIYSKAQGAQWALQNLDEKWHSTIQKAYDSYQTASTFCSFPAEEIRSFYNEMAEKIHKSKIIYPITPTQI